jgi:hypothetical protein
VTDVERFFSRTKRADDIRPGMESPCLEWTASLTRGYGKFYMYGKSVRAHRVAWKIVYGNITDGLHVLHKCDNPICVDANHLFLGTDADNMADMIAKGRDRKAVGERSGARLHPQSMARIGDANGARKHPERMARGDRNGARLYPERLAHHCGEKHGMAKLNESDARHIIQRCAEGCSRKILAAEFGVGVGQITRIYTRKRWAHLNLEEGIT